MKTEDGRLFVIAGASRSGKTAWTRQATKGAGRVFAWDPEDQWAALPGFRKITSRAEFAKASLKPGPLKLAFVAGGDLKEGFNFFAQACFYAGRYIEPMHVIAEELADVTTPSKAPGHWGILLRRGLKRGITIWAISQRWSEADKTAVGNASDFVVFRQSSGDDVAYMSRKTGIEQHQLRILAPLEFVHMNALNGDITEGIVRF